MRTFRFSSILFCCLILPAIARSDLLPNGTFDHDLAGWTTSPAVTWTSFDAGGSVFSGSALGTNHASGPSSLYVSRGCIPFLPGNQVVISGKIYVPSGQMHAYYDLWAEFNDGPGCTGSFAGYGISLPAVTTFDTWTTTQRTLYRPAGVRSLSVALRIGTDAAGTAQAYFDDIYARSATGDFDLTGQTDVVWRTHSGAMSAWLMNGLAVASSGALPTVVDANWQPVALGDFQRDGKADILWRNASTGDNVIWFMSGLSAPVVAVLPNVPPSWEIDAVGDFQNDGKADIFWRNKSTGANVVWFMDGPNVAASAMLPTVGDPTWWHVVAVGDFQGDGKSDILWHNYNTGDNSIWFMDGASVALSAALPPAPPPVAWVVAGVGDFQGDGKSDILWRNVFTGENLLWLMNGPALAVSVNLPPVPPPWSVGLVGDFQGDGKADILWRNPVTGDNSIWLMNGPAVAASATLPNVNTAFTIVKGH